jgi:hypothetical protein
VVGVSKEKVTKASILTAGIGCVTTGLSIVKDGVYLYGVLLVLLGFGLVVSYIYLVDREVEKMLRGMKR